MPYITREDGEHFVIPSYRDTLSVSNKSVLKKEILSLCQNYGEYITLQRRSPTQYEVAFSPDIGYLLGESIWYSLKQPQDMIYCEAIPNTTEAILVIVKAGSVYLDGRFPIENIQDELIVFKTQQNQFDIFIYGDVPISQGPDPEKFYLDASSIKSFQVLDEALFPNLPRYKQFLLQLVNPVLKEHGIGVLPVKQLAFVLLVLGLVWLWWSYTATRPVIQGIPQIVASNVYKDFFAELATPSPDQEIQAICNKLFLLLTIPGWQAKDIVYAGGTLQASITSQGGTIQDLNLWAQRNNADVDMQKNGFFLKFKKMELPNRPLAKNIYPLKEVIERFVDNLNMVLPGNNMTLDNSQKEPQYTRQGITIKFSSITPVVFDLIGQQMQDLPFTIQKVTLSMENGVLTGNITINALGN